MAIFKIQQHAVTAAAAFVILNAVVPSAAGAQSPWTGPHQSADRPVVQLETLRPSFSDPELSFVGATAAGFVTARLPLAERVSIVADLPFARAAWELEEGTGSSRRIGNPYVGAEWRTSARLTTELGVRLPTGDVEDLDALGAMVVGMGGELERMEGFAPETLSLHAAASYRAELTPALSATIRGNSAFLTGEGGDEDLLLGYTGQLWYDAGRADVGGGITGRWNSTQDGRGQERATHQAILGGGYTIGRIRPGLQIRLPLDGAMKDLTGFTAGLSLGYSF